MTFSRTLFDRSSSAILALVGLVALAPACQSTPPDPTSALNQALNQTGGSDGTGGGQPSGCGTTSEDRDGGAGGSTPTGGGTCDASGDCGACQNCAMTDACSTQINACLASADCQSLLDCLQPCQDETCAETCFSQFPNAQQPYSDAAECVFGACESSCGGSTSTGGGSGGSTDGGTGGGACDATADCGACQDCAMRDQCSTQIDACVASADCQSLIACLEPCQDQTCADGCFSQFPNAQQLYSDAAACVFCDCQSSCGAPADACGP